jgi:hypothetical protein
MSLADLVRRLEDCLVVCDREITSRGGGELTRMKLMALLLDVSAAERGTRPGMCGWIDPKVTFR